MSWFGNRRKKEFERQVCSLQENLPVAMHRDVNRRVWEVGIQLRSGVILVCQLILPAEFPDVAPIVSLTTPCRHAWLAADGTSVVGHPELRTWQPHYDFGRIAKEIISQLTSTPPVPLLAQPQHRQPATAQPHQSTQQPQQHQPPQGVVRNPSSASRNPSYVRSHGAAYPSHSANNGGASRQRSTSSSSSSARPVPGDAAQQAGGVDLPSTYPALQNASLEGLRLMNGNSEEGRVSRGLLLRDHDFLKNRVRERHELRDGCKILAQKNLTVGEELRQLRNEVDGLEGRVNERLEHLMASVDRQKLVAEHFSPENAIAMLQQRREEAEGHSMAITEHFMHNEDADLDQFCKDYIAARTAYHVSTGMYEHASRTAAGAR